MSDYAKCEKRERDRQRKWRKTEQGKFEASFVRMDYEASEATLNSPAWLSDGGKGAQDIIDAVDGEPTREELISSARKRLVESAPRLVEVFDLIIENGTNRKESKWVLAWRLQNRALKEKRAQGASGSL